MAVAKSFQNFEFLCDPYTVNGKQYIRVRNPKTGTERQVRWYNEIEYKKAYPETIAPTGPENNPYYKPQKDVLGFNKGYITIFKGDTAKHIDWFRLSIARYARNWGWYIVSTDEIPADLPKDLIPVRLPWDAVGQENGKLKPEHLVKAAADALLYDAGVSEYQGEIGQRIERTLTVTKAIQLDSDFGHSVMHIMEDADGNIYVWTTASKSWVDGSIHKIRGTIKDHRIYKATKQTILTRCMEVK